MTDSASDPQTTLAAAEASRLGPAQKTALRFLAEGRSYREPPGLPASAPRPT